MAIDAASQLHATLIEAVSAQEEILAVEAWRDELTPSSGVCFTVRRRDSGVTVPIGQVDPTDFDELEIVFEGQTAAASELVWRPQSSRALEALFVE